jgi:hypothetical protein
MIMPAVIDPETLYVSDLPGVWSPVQWELSESERAQEIEAQATASLLWAVSVPEAILRLLLNETAIERVYEPPERYDSELQGEWDETLVTFSFKHGVKIEKVERGSDFLYIEFKIADLGYWSMEIEPEKVTIGRI